VPEPPADPISRTGDLWLMGEHRLLCGDCTDGCQIGIAANGQKANIVFTSPPYAQQRNEEYGGIEEGEYCGWWTTVQGAIRPSLEADGSLFLNIKPHARQKERSLYVLDLVAMMVRDLGWLLVDEYCWLRTGIPQQVVNRFKNAFEPIYWFANTEDFTWYPEQARHKSDHVPLALGKGAGDTNAARRQGKGGGAIQGNEIVSGMAYPSNVIDIKKNADAIGHPAAFHPDLPAFFIRAYTQQGDAVIEPFSGSGTTIIACEQLNRKCYAIEIEPRYVDVAVIRWQNYTGKTATRESDGLTFNECINA